VPLFTLRQAALLAPCLVAACANIGLNAPHPGAAPDPSWFGAQRRIELQLDDGALAIEPERSFPEVRMWVARAASAIRAYYGHFPVQHARITVERIHGSGVRWARAFSHSGAQIRIAVGRNTTSEQFESDWILIHEFVHLALPQLAEQHDWLQEGAATYVEPVARARAGQLSAERVWAEFVRQMPNGLPGPKDRGLDYTSSWARIYWGGALFCLVADVEIRKRSDNRFGLRDALRAILEEGGTLDHRWKIREALRSGDRATGVAVLSELYDQWGAAPMQVDLEALWRDLGVERNGPRAALNDEAPLAAIRRAITEQEALPVQ
jgi:hypothetical protein